MVDGLLIYNVPFYCQAVLDTNAKESSIRHLPFLITLLFSPIASGVLIDLIGFYVLLMWLGAVIHHRLRSPGHDQVRCSRGALAGSPGFELGCVTSFLLPRFNVSCVQTR